jgi:hypothetical protein
MIHGNKIKLKENENIMDYMEDLNKCI